MAPSCPVCGSPVSARDPTCPRCGRPSPGPPDPRMKKWLLVQVLGGALVIAGLLVTTFALAQAAQARLPLRLPPASLLVPAGVAVHVAGRLGARRFRG